MQYFYVYTKTGRQFGSFDSLEKAVEFAKGMPITTSIYRGNQYVRTVKGK